MGQGDSRIRVLQDVILQYCDVKAMLELSLGHSQMVCDILTVLVKYEYSLPHLSLFLVSRFLSMPSMRFLNQVAMLACLAAGCPCMICRGDIAYKINRFASC